jgi:hypothetical protein
MRVNSALDAAHCAVSMSGGPLVPRRTYARNVAEKAPHVPVTKMNLRRLSASAQVNVGFSIVAD